MRILALALVLTLAIASRSRAQDGRTDAPSASDAQAQAVLVEAVREYDAGNYEEAYALFLRVHELRPTARTQRALGKTAFGLRRYREAARWLAAALDDARTPLTDEMRAEVEGFLLRARSFLGHFTVRVQPESASVDVDGQPLEGSDLDLDIGDHEIVARAPGHEPLTRRVTVRGGEHEVVGLELIASTPTSTIVVSAADPGGTYRDLGWAAVVVGGALLAGGVVATVLWSDGVASLNANIDRGLCTADANEQIVAGPAICYEQQNRYRLALPLVYVGYLAGAAFLGAGIGLVLGAPSASSSDDAALACGPFGDVGISCVGSF